MEAKRAILPLVLAVLSGVFLITALAVHLTGGRSSRWVSRKMKIGGLILSLTALLNSCTPQLTDVPQDGNVPWTCYIMVAPELQTNRFFLEDIADSTITLNHSNAMKIYGEIRKRTLETYSFSIENQLKTVIYKGEIEAKDGSFESETEKIVIRIPAEINEGNYILRLFAAESSNQPEWSPDFVKLIIK